jgi:hypothetical protein
MEKQIIHQQDLVSKKRKSRFNLLEDSNLKTLVEKHGTKDWGLISSLMINRNPRQCKERWESYLSPRVDHSLWTTEEDNLLMQKRNEFGSHWVKISMHFPKRTDVSVKNRWIFLQKKIHDESEKHALVHENNQINNLRKEVKANISNLILDIENLLQKEQKDFERANPFDIAGEIPSNIFDSSEEFFLF